MEQEWILLVKLLWKRPHGSPKHTWENNLQTDLGFNEIMRTFIPFEAHTMWNITDPLRRVQFILAC